MTDPHATHDWLQDLVDRIDAVVWEADPATLRFNYVSSSAERLLGYPTATWLEPGFWERSLHPDDRAGAISGCAAAAAVGESHRLSYRLLARDGSAVWVDDSVVVIPADESSPAVLRGVLVDTTPRLREDEHFRFLVENSSDIITILEPDAKVRYANPAVERLLGYRPDELMGDNGYAYVHPEDVEGVRQAFGRATSTPGFSPPFEFRFRHRDGSWRVLETIARNMIGEPMGAVLATSRDVTSQRHVAELHRMEAVGRLATVIAHDFNNVLTVISGHAELLQAAAPAQLNAGLGEVLRASSRGAALTRNLLRFVRPEEREAEGAVDLAAALPELVSLLDPIIGSGIEVRVEVEPGTPSVSMDHEEFDHVVLNLVLNARDAMPNGGSVTISARWNGAFVQLTVSDTGPGIPADVRERLFDPFFTTKGDAGTGLGLASVRSIVERHGGEVVLESHRGSGTTFRLRLRPSEAP